MVEVRDFVQSKINEARNGKVGGSFVGSMEVNGVKYTVTASVVRGGFLWLGKRIRIAGTAELLQIPQTHLANRSAAVTHSHPSGDATGSRLALEQTILIDPKSNAEEIESFVENIEIVPSSIGEMWSSIQDSRDYDARIKEICTETASAAGKTEDFAERIRRVVVPSSLKQISENRHRSRCCATGIELIAREAEEKSVNYSFFSKERRFYKKLAAQLRKLSKEMKSAIDEMESRNDAVSAIDTVVSAVQMEKFYARASKCCMEANCCLDRMRTYSLKKREIALQNIQRAWQGKPLINKGKSKF